MLVLTRYEKQRVVIVLPDGSRITVEVVQSNGKVKLGFDASIQVAIWREEILPPDPEPTPSGG